MLSGDPSEYWLFLKRWLRNPFRLGTFAPISHNLARKAAQHIASITPKGAPIIEIGAGTGRLTSHLIQQGLTNITLVELDPELHAYLNKRFHDNLAVQQIIQGDAAELTTLLPDTKVATVVSVIPLMYLSLEKRKQIIEAGWSMLQPEGRFVHVCYTPHSPVQEFRTEKILGQWWPPGFVWEFVYE